MEHFGVCRETQYINGKCMYASTPQKSYIIYDLALASCVRGKLTVKYTQTMPTFICYSERHSV